MTNELGRKIENVGENFSKAISSFDNKDTLCTSPDNFNHLRSRQCQHEIAEFAIFDVHVPS